jgi:hypothetical protein
MATIIGYTPDDAILLGREEREEEIRLIQWLLDTPKQAGRYVVVLDDEITMMTIDVDEEGLFYVIEEGNITQ